MAEHSHPHHDHGHSHEDHHRDEGDTYFIDQLCMIGLSGMFGGICLSLWFLQRQMLNLLLGEQFHPFVLASGFALVILSVARAIVLWGQTRKPTPVHTHHHDHDHGHATDHEHAIQEKSLLVQAVQPGLGLTHSTVSVHEHSASVADGHDHDHGDPHHAHDHHHDHDEADHDHGWAPWRYVVILIPIIFFFLGLPNKPPAVQVRGVAIDYEQLILAFTSIVYEAMPFIVLGVLIAGLLEEFVPQQAITRIIPRNRALAILLGGVLGLVFPMCECGIIVVMKRLLRKGLPLSVCVSYMLAGPVINVVVMTSTYVAFNPPQERDYILGGPLYVVAWRVGLSYLIAFITALCVDWQWNRHGRKLLHPSVMRGLDRQIAADEEAKGSRPWSERISNITQTALNDYVDIMAFLVLGAILAAGGKFLMKQTNIQDLFQQEPAIAILIMMSIAVLFCLCSEADAFVAANFPLYWPPASKLAFLVLGPMLDLKLYLMYTRVFRSRLIFTIIGAVVTQVFVYTMVLAYFDDTPLPRSTEDIMLAPEEELQLSSIAFGPDLQSQLVHFGGALHRSAAANGVPVDFQSLESMANAPDLRQRYKGETVEVRGQFAPRQGTKQIFNLVRLKISCCANDAVQLNVPIISRESIDDIKPSDWVKVTGKVDFREFNGSYSTILQVASRADVVPCDPAPNPYIK